MAKTTKAPAPRPAPKTVIKGPDGKIVVNKSGAVKNVPEIRNRDGNTPPKGK